MRVKALVEVALPEKMVIEGETLTGEKLVEYVIDSIIDSSVAFKIEESEVLRSPSGERLNIAWETTLIGVEDDGSANSE